MHCFSRWLFFVLCFIFAALESQPAAAQSSLIPLPTRRGMVFDHAGHYLYVSTSSGAVLAYNLSSLQFDATYNIGSSLNGIDIAPDDSFILAAENNAGTSQGTFYRLNLTNGTVTNINYTRNKTLGETGGWDVAIGSNGLALVTTQGDGSDTPLRQINLSTNAISTRAAPGGAPLNALPASTRIARSADRTRMYFVEQNLSSGPVFTYNASSNTFGPVSNTDSFNEGAAAAVSRNGTMLGTLLPDFPYFGATDTSLDAAPNFGFVHSFSGMNGGIAFDAVSDIFYTLGNGGTQIIAFNTNTFKELFRMNIGETVRGNLIQFGTGTLVASQDGKYLGLETPSGIRLFDVTNNIQGPAPAFTEPRDMVFDHSGTYLYIATYDGHVWPYNLITRQLETPYTFDGSLLGLDIAPDDSFLVAAQALAGVAQGAFQKFDLQTGTLTNLTYIREPIEAGAWGVKITSNGTAFGTTDCDGSAWVPLHQINFSTNTVSRRTDAPGSFNNEIRNHSQIQRGADRTRLYILESDDGNGSVFTYSALSDTFGPSLQTGSVLDNTSAAVNRTGSLLCTRLNGQSSASLSGAPSFNFVHSFGGFDSAVAFDAVRDRVYGVNSSTDQILGFDTNSFAQQLVLQIGEDVGPGSTQFGPGTMIASQDGHYLALQTATTIRVYAIPPSSGTAMQVSRVAHLSNGHFIIQAFAAPNSTNTVQATSNLQATFSTIGSVVADANGAIQFEDVNAGGFSSRFYNISSP
jgi:hypothetical protein